MTTYIDTIKLFHNLGSETADEATCSVCFYMGTSESPYDEKVRVVGWDDDPDFRFLSDREFVNNQLTKVSEWSEPGTCNNIRVKGMVAPKSYRTAEIKLDGNYTIQVTRYIYLDLNGKMLLIPAATVGSLDLI